MNAIIPVARTPVTVRVGTLADLPFLDSLQKLHTKQVGWMPTAQFEGKIKAGHVLIAEEGTEAHRHEGTEGADATALPLRASVPSCLRASPLGYCIGNDQYFKRDDVGIIYQMNVVPGRQRGLVGATLLKAMFERAAYGCKLFCCWCAQDIEANRFWEAMGFVPLAFRAGSEKKSRVHIFWQRRIRSGDETTPYWFPSQTGSGAIREDRLVLPIPPGTHWSDAKPIVLPGAESVVSGQLSVVEGRQLEGPRAKRVRVAQPKVDQNAIVSGGLRFGPAPQAVAVPEAKAKKEPKPKRKNDPKLVAAARELRDRWLERVNAGLYLPPVAGKYDVSKTLSEVEGSRQIGAAVEVEGGSMAIGASKLLPGAAQAA